MDTPLAPGRQGDIVGGKQDPGELPVGQVARIRLDVRHRSLPGQGVRLKSATACMTELRTQTNGSLAPQELFTCDIAAACALGRHFS